MKRVLLVSWLAVATVPLVAGCSDLAGEERPTEGSGEKVSVDQLPAPVKAAIEREAAGGVRVLFSRARLGRDEASYRRERCARRSRRSPPRLIANDTVDANILLGLIGAHSGFSSWAKVSIDWPRIGCAWHLRMSATLFATRIPHCRLSRAPVSVFADPLEAPSRSSARRPRPP